MCQHNFHFHYAPKIMKTLLVSLLLLSLVAFNAAQTTLNPNIQPSSPSSNTVVHAFTKVSVQYSVVGSLYSK